MSARRTPTVAVYDETNTTLITTLDGATGISWRDALNDVGAGSLFLPLDDTDRAAMVPRRILRFGLDGVPCWSAIVPPASTNLIASQEEPGEGDTYNSNGLLAIWQRAVVLPELGVERISPEMRRFDFATRYYDVSGWSNAVKIKRQGDYAGPTPTLTPEVLPGQWDGDNPDDLAPSGMGAIDPDAEWIWSQAQDDENDPPQAIGTIYLVKEFELDDEQLVGFFFTADDGYEVILDGEVIAAELLAFAWGTARQEMRFLSAGWHRIAVRATNMERAQSASNVAGFILTATEMDAGGKTPGAVIVHTDATWKALGYPLIAPTMTPGEIARILLEEVQARDDSGFWANVTLSCTDTEDSDGQTWTRPIDMIVQVGSSYLDVLRQLVDTSVDIRMQPAGLVLDIYNKGTLGTLTSVELVRGGLATAGTTEGEETLGTVALVQDSTGEWRWIESDSAAIERVEFTLSAGSAPSYHQANRLAEAVFADTATPTWHATYTVEEDDGAIAYDDWTVGDTVTVTGPDLTDEDMRVEALTVSADGEDGNGFAVFTIEGRLFDEAGS